MSKFNHHPNSGVILDALHESRDKYSAVADVLGEIRKSRASRREADLKVAAEATDGDRQSTTPAAEASEIPSAGGDSSDSSLPWSERFFRLSRRMALSEPESDVLVDGAPEEISDFSDASDDPSPVGLAELQESLQRAQSYQQQLEEASAKVLQLDSIEIKLRESHEVQAELETRNAALVGRIEAMTLHTRRAESDLAERESELAHAREEVRELQVQMDRYGPQAVARLEQLVAAATCREETLQVQLEEFQGLIPITRQSEEELAAHRQELAGAQQRILSLETELQEKSHAFDCLRAQAAEAEAARIEQIRELEDKAVAAEDHCEELRAQLVTAEAQQVGAAEKLEALRNTFVERENRLSEAEESVATMSRDLGETRERADALQASLVRMQGTDAARAIQALETELHDLRSVKQDLNEANALSEREKSAFLLLQNRLVQAETQLAELRSAPLPTNPTTVPSGIPIPTLTVPPSPGRRLRKKLAIFCLLIAVVFVAGSGGVILRDQLPPTWVASLSGWLKPTTLADTQISLPVSPVPVAQAIRNPASLLQNTPDETITRQPLAIVSGIKSQGVPPAVAWNNDGGETTLPLDGLFNPAGQFDYSLLRQVWLESARGSLAPRSTDDAIPVVRHGYDSVTSMAVEGDPQSQYLLGLREIVNAYAGFRNGVDATDPLREAYQWMQKAAHTGHPDALYVGGQMRRLGIGGREDADKGLVVISYAAKAGQPDAQEFLGVEMLNLYFQTRVDEYARTSAQNFRAAAEQGRPLGQLMIGRMLTEGIGVQQETAQGVAWLVKAAENGSDEAYVYLQDAADAGSDSAQRALPALRGNQGGESGQIAADENNASDPEQQAGTDADSPASSVADLPQD